MDSVPWFIMNSNISSVPCTLSLEVTNTPGTPKVSRSNLTRTFFLTVNISVQKIGLLFVWLCFVGLVARSRIVFFAVNNCHCNWFKRFSIFKIRRNRNLCLLLVVILPTGFVIFFSFFLFIGLIKFGLINIDLVATYSVVWGSKKVCVRACALI